LPVTATITVGVAPVGVAVNPAGTEVFVTNQGSGTVSVINTAADTVIATIPGGSLPLAVAD
jgi:YVTN family beta-propeller protein